MDEQPKEVTPIKRTLGMRRCRPKPEKPVDSENEKEIGKENEAPKPVQCTPKRKGTRLGTSLTHVQSDVKKKRTTSSSSQTPPEPSKTDAAAVATKGEAKGEQATHDKGEPTAEKANPNEKLESEEDDIQLDLKV